PVSGSLHLYAQTNGSAHPVSPLHQPYLDLLSPAEEWKIPLTWLIWLLLFLKIIAMFWLTRKYKQCSQKTEKPTELTE
ncbi:MAG: Unknown protein, partial [uncultured Thiotrichaceae bacterium]